MEAIGFLHSGSFPTGFVHRPGPFTSEAYPNVWSVLKNAVSPTCSDLKPPRLINLAAGVDQISSFLFFVFSAMEWAT